MAEGTRIDFWPVLRICGHLLPPPFRNSGLDWLGDIRHDAIQIVALDQQAVYTCQSLNPASGPAQKHPHVPIISTGYGCRQLTTHDSADISANILNFVAYGLVSLNVLLVSHAVPNIAGPSCARTAFFRLSV